MFGFGRERKSRGAGPRGRVRGVRGGGVASPGVEEGGREVATAKQEVAGAIRARATPRLCLLAEEEEDKGGGGGGGLGQREELGRLQVSGPGGLQVMFPSLSLFFLFYFCFLFF